MLRVLGHTEVEPGESEYARSESVLEYRTRRQETEYAESARRLGSGTYRE